MKNKKLSPITYGRNDITNLTKKILYKGFFVLEQIYFRYRKFDGSMSNEVCREVLQRGNNTVALLAYDAKRDEVVLIEQVRIATIEAQSSPWMLELIAGMVDKEGENLEDVARREAMEEAGITISRCQQLVSYFPSSGGLAEKLFLFIGEVDAEKAKGIHGLSEENEDIKVHVVHRDIAYSWVENGIINNAASIIALQWLQLNYAQLKKEWDK